MDDGTAFDGGAAIADACACNPALNSARCAALGPNDGAVDGMEMLPGTEIETADGADMAGGADGATCDRPGMDCGGAAYVTPAVGPDRLTGEDGARCVE